MMLSTAIVRIPPIFTCTNISKREEGHPSKNKHSSNSSVTKPNTFPKKMNWTKNWNAKKIMPLLPNTNSFKC